MDPDVVLTYAKAGDREAARALLEWVDAGGFEPIGFIRAEVQSIADGVGAHRRLVG